jgi:hypothetical protein
LRTLHGGTSQTIAFLRRKYWIVDCKNLVRAHIHQFMVCFHFKAKVSEQIMGILPKERIQPCHPFIHVGVDYAGPYNIRTTKERGHKSYKGYFSIFVCLATKAIHIEAVSDLTSS